MLFNVEADTGDRIEGYFVPDSYTAQATLSLVAGGSTLLTKQTSESRNALVAAGRHGNGTCGFLFAETELPGLRQIDSLDIVDTKSGLAFYRRRPESQTCGLHLLRLELGHLRLAELDRSLDARFQVALPSIDRLGQETILQSFMLTNISSLYVSARLSFRSYEFSIDDKFKKVCILQDPYVELAETMIDLTETVAGAGSEAGLREQLSLETACRYLANFDLADAGELKRCMVKMPDEVQAAILNTMSRQLSARTENETANTTYVATSIETLSKFDIVGVREQPDTILEPLAALLGVSSSSLPAFPDPSPAAQAVAQSLRNLSFMAKLLDLDLDVYNQVLTVLEANR